MLSPAFGLILIAVLLSIYLLRCLSSPLNNIPGPVLAKYTSWILKWHEFHANRTRYIHALHLMYGPVVRIAPNEVAFASQGAVKEIYCSAGSGYDKTEFYDLFKAYGRRTMFTTLNKDDHARRKRLLADRYANSNVVRQPSLSGIAERASSFGQICAQSVGGSLDLFADEEIMKEVAFDDSLQNRLVQYYSPTVHKLVAKALYLFAKPRETPLADRFVLEASAQADVAPFTLVSRLHEKESAALDSLDVAAECLDHMAAGIDTTGDALCFLMWELSQPRSFRFQQRLQRELLEAGPETPFDKLPFLDAVVMEGLRCFPAIPMSLPRFVPLGGREIDGFFLPEGTIVSCQAYSLHRINEEVFPQPDLFNPERWMEREGDAQRRRLMFAFANGGRGCVGKHLALAEMKLLLREVYSRFTTLPDPTMTEESMAMSDQLISSRPLGARCLLSFSPIALED
ncbi:Cytochrome P450 [Coniochaeta hoffmannii]|uniref:Cytochrome P450 n=1 Tax=Coniochaeta hoffmannii TaxID=91930 RepID=A0AA38SEH3_9PEZI|nr:Cytochrome P450 [Coniochaeta hoffmannii]